MTGSGKLDGVAAERIGSELAQSNPRGFARICREHRLWLQQDGPTHHLRAPCGRARRNGVPSARPESLLRQAALLPRPRRNGKSPHTPFSASPRLCVALFALSAPACWSQQPPAARADWQCAPVGREAERQAEALRKQGQFRDAITACEGFLRAHPDATAGCQLFLAEKALANLVDRILLRDLKERDQTVPICEAALKEFEDVPYYWAVCAKYVIQAKMWRDGERAEAADLANQVVEKLGENLPTGHVASKLLP